LTNSDEKKVLHHGAHIKLNAMGKTFFIDQVIGDNTLIVQNPDEISFPEGKDLEYTVLPKVDQSQVYMKGYEVLNEDKCFAIFPEGGSHDRTELLPLKAGPAVFCLGSMKEFGLETKIVGVGLNYDKPHKFRSIAIVEFSTPYGVSKEDFAEYKTDKRKIISKVLEDITELLKDVKLRAPSYEHMLNYHLVRSIYVDDMAVSEKEKLVVERRFATNIEKAKEFDDVKEMLANVDEYRRGIKSIGVSDWQLRQVKGNFIENTIALWYSIFWAMITMTIGLPG